MAGCALLYAPEELGGLPVATYVDALKAEGVPVSQRRDYCEHLRPLIQQGFDLYGHNRGPIGPDAYDHHTGDLPVAEDVVKRLFFLPAYIEPVEGVIEQIVAAFAKVSAEYEALL